MPRTTGYRPSSGTARTGRVEGQAQGSGRTAEPPPDPPVPLAAPWAGPGWRRGRADLSAGMDELAARAGHADGVELVVKELGVAPGEVADALPDQAWAWFLECYERFHARGDAAAIGDIVVISSGIASTIGAGWGDLWGGPSA